MDKEKELTRKFFEAKLDYYMKIDDPSNLPFYFLSDLIETAYKISRDPSSFGYTENDFDNRLKRIGFIRDDETFLTFLSREDEAASVSTSQESVQDTPDDSIEFKFDFYKSDEEYRREEAYDFGKVGFIRKLLENMKASGKKPTYKDIIFDSD